MGLLSWDQIKGRAIRFSKKHKFDSNEESHAQSFERDFIAVFTDTDALTIGDFEYKVPQDNGHNGYFDFIIKGQLAIEMKSKGKNLDFAYKQLKEYVLHLSGEDIPDLLMLCDFETIELHRRSTGETTIFKTKDLHKYVKCFANIAGYATTRTFDSQIEVNIKAAEKMAKLHDTLNTHGYSGHDLEVYLVRLLFCLFAEDTGIFDNDLFLNYILNSKKDGSDLDTRISKLFEVLNMPKEERDKRNLLSNDLKLFRYINGGLFSTPLPTAEFNKNMHDLLVECCKFDWGKISPAIFGAMFQGVMDKQQRRELGAHYTSEENILKVINPLFMDELWEEFEKVKTNSFLLEKFHNKISELKFIDPACGCGNFLIITYRELRHLELEVLKMKADTNQMLLFDIMPMVKVSVTQFYGIEIDDFASQIAQVGMWLMDHQMNIRVSEYFGQYFVRLPLKASATIINGNALIVDWEDIISKNDVSYILGNPPFIGYSNQTTEQKNEILRVFLGPDAKPIPSAGKIDYVAAWYYKAAKYIQNTNIKVAFVSTNSICQGEQVAPIWKTIFDLFDVKIDFAYRTFKWENAAKGNAAVHCVIIGFSQIGNTKKYIFDKDVISIANNINPYLIDAPALFVVSRSNPICKVADMVYGNKPADGGFLILENEEKENLLLIEPQAEEFIKPLLGAQNFLNGQKRWCLWLVDANPKNIRNCPNVLARIEGVRKFRLESKKAATQKCADTPTVFMEIRQPNTNYILVPCHSSEKRRYVPIGFFSSEIIVTNAVQIIPSATLYNFAILSSNVHNAWMRAVCGRIKSDYRYSKDIVYNNFPWPDPTTEQIAEIEITAQEILDARSSFPDNSLADLYDPNTMPLKLLKAHKHLDKLVYHAYGKKWDIKSESSCVAYLMQLHQK